MKTSSKQAAYTVVDVSGYPRQMRDALQADAISGGQVYGLIMVEFRVNGPMTEPVFGYYPETAELWATSLKEFEEEGVIEANNLGEDELPPVDHSASARRRPK
jgi:hypothetical protein